MPARTFVDTNVFFYSVDTTDERKREIARSTLRTLARGRRGVISTQVTLELASNLVKKLNMEPVEIIGVLRALDIYECVPVSPTIAQDAVALHAAHSLSIWDSAIVAAAIRARCTVVLTEDMQHGCTFAGCRVENPFLA